MKTVIPHVSLSVLALCQILPAIQTTKPEVLTDINRTSRYVMDSKPKGLLARHDATWQTKRFQKVAGWMESTAGIKEFKHLPKAAQNYLQRIEEVCETPLDMISTGPDRVDTIVLRHPFK